MCGVAGWLKAGGFGADEAARELRRMGDAIEHRGPDDHGVWFDADTGIGFSHRRLSIVDLSPLGHQPMVSASGRYVVTFNGEIYNYRDIRDELTKLGHVFKSSSDTEVLLASIEQWGLESALQRSVGMFALGLWDRQDRVLRLARDRFGEKPLYYGLFGRSLLFGSELKALRCHREWKGQIDRDALALFVRHDFVPAPFSIFRGVKKVRPGSMMTVRLDGSGIQLSETDYWNSRDLVDEGLRNPFSGSDTDAIDAVEAALGRSISRQMVADVPVGAFLSGGVDSSVVVALMQKASSNPVHTFSIGFSEREFDESAFARSVAKHLGTRHTELIVTPKDALDVIPRLPHIYDEPFADSSQIPTFLVSQLARRDVTVSLSGDAADELFGGYARYTEALERWRRRSTAAGRLKAGMATLLDRSTMGSTGISDVLGERVARLSSPTLAALYRSMISFCQKPDRIVLDATEPQTVANDPGAWPAVDGLALLMFIDTSLYMIDDVLAKVDRAAMSVALETRVPFLDPEVAKLAWKIPTQTHFSDGRGKWVLRQILARHVPVSLFDRPKMGFAVPVARWLRSELKPWAGELLNPARLRREGWFDESKVSSRWKQHLAGSDAWTPHLWGILMFQAWLETLDRTPN